jgi:hypothetical protein
LNRLLSLLLLGLLLYNMVGYSVVYLLEETPVVASRHVDYLEKDAFSSDIVIKVPLSVPYQVSWENAEPAEGKIRHEGEHYQMKSRQLINDTMYVHCEFDQNARDRYTSLVSRIQDEIAGSNARKDSRSTILKNFLKEFLALAPKHIFYVLEWVQEHQIPVSMDQQIIPNATPHVPSPPPDLV